MISFTLAALDSLRLFFVHHEAVGIYSFYGAFLFVQVKAFFVNTSDATTRVDIARASMNIELSNTTVCASMAFPTTALLPNSRDFVKTLN